MSKIKYSDFETIGNIIGSINFKYDNTKESDLDCLNKIWNKIMLESNISKVYDIAKNNSVIIVCKDSFVAGELYLMKDALLKQFQEMAQKENIKVEDIKFDYKKWEDG